LRLPEAEQVLSEKHYGAVGWQKAGDLKQVTGLFCSDPQTSLLGSQPDQSCRPIVSAPDSAIRPEYFLQFLTIIGRPR
jgi:hypothetical protein